MSGLSIIVIFLSKISSFSRLDNFDKFLDKYSKLDINQININKNINVINDKIKKINNLEKQWIGASNLFKNKCTKNNIFDEDEYNDLVEEKNDLKKSIGGIEKDIKTKQSLITEMKEGEICSLCKQPLKDVDHTEQINTLEGEKSAKEKELEKEN